MYLYEHLLGSFAGSWLSKLFVFLIVFYIFSIVELDLLLLAGSSFILVMVALVEGTWERATLDIMLE